MKKRLLAILMASVIALPGNTQAAQAAGSSRTTAQSTKSTGTSAANRIKTKFVIRDANGKSLKNKTIKPDTEYQLIFTYDASAVKTGSLKNLRITVTHNYNKPAILQASISSPGTKAIKKNIELPLSKTLNKDIRARLYDLALYQNAVSDTTAVTYDYTSKFSKYIIKNAKPGKSGKITLNFAFYQAADGMY